MRSSVRVIQIAGFLGSGKTTSMIRIAKSLTSKYGRKVAIIVNEIGSVPVDAKVLEGYGLKVSELGGGCICCELLISLAETLTNLSRLVKPDIVLIEPTGVSIPDQVKEGIKLGGSEVSLEVGPAVVLLDALLERELIEGDPTENFILRQLADADIVALNKIDAVGEATIRRFERKVREINPKAKLFRISALRGDGIDKLIDCLVRGKA
jgi:G3E family GTPase